MTAIDIGNLNQQKFVLKLRQITKQVVVLMFSTIGIDVFSSDPNFPKQLSLINLYAS